MELGMFNERLIFVGRVSFIVYRSTILDLRYPIITIVQLPAAYAEASAAEDRQPPTLKLRRPKTANRLR
jgi:hypothetical protein